MTMARPQIMWSGFGRDDRIREPSPAASTIAETPMCLFYRNRRGKRWHGGWLRGEDSNPYTRHQKPLSYH
jgi:hypothetical protein